MVWGVSTLQRSFELAIALENVEQLKVLSPETAAQLLRMANPLTTRCHADADPVYPILIQSGPAAKM